MTTIHKDLIDYLTNYIFLEDAPAPADLIFIPGNAHPQMAEKAASLYKDGLAPLLLPSGKYSITLGHFAGVQSKQSQYPGPYTTEWEFLSDVLSQNGVPHDSILREDQSTYTYQNAIYSRQVTDAHDLTIHKAILCVRNYHAKRAAMYYQLLFPETKFYVVPCDLDGINRETWHQSEEGIDAVMAEVNRITRQFSLML